jgi:multicomponent Na+:H+ antiporter subunit D
MVGIPPLSGFVSKFALIDAGVASHQYTIVAISLAVSLLTLLSMVRIWAGVFWNPAEQPLTRPRQAGVAVAAPRRVGLAAMMVPTAVLAGCCLAVAALAGPLYSLSERTAGDLMNPAGYITEVLAR